MTIATSLTLEGLLPPSVPTLPLTVTLRTEQLTNGWTGEVEQHRVLRAVNGLYRYEWRLAELTGRDFDATGVPGGATVSGFRAILAAVANGLIPEEA